MAVQSWHPELDEDDRRRGPRKKRRRSAVVVALWTLIAAMLVIGVGLGVAWYTGSIPMLGGSNGAPARVQAPATATAPVPAAQQTAQAANVPAPPTVVKREVFGDWIYSCIQAPNSDAVRCLIAQQLSHPETRQPIFTWRIVQDGKGGFIGEWETPTGVIVGRGILLDAGTEKPIAIPFQACTQTGCLAIANLAPDFLETLSTATAATATVFPIGGQGVRLVLSVNGLAQGLTTLKQ